MGKKYGFNIVFFVFITILFLIISCVKSGNSNTEGQLLKTDRDFSELSAKEGMIKAFLYYVSDSGVMLRDDAYPLRGKRAINDLFSTRNDTSFILTWEPLFESIARSGDMGYTYGIFTSRVKATGEESRGTYITIWKKQTDGQWKFVLDAGTQGLPKNP
jgi:ketosteroid isomerase-like protein